MLALRKVRQAFEERGRSKGMKNWKTSLMAALAMVSLAAKQLLPNELAPVLDAAAGLFNALGLFFAKDHDVSGGNR